MNERTPQRTGAFFVMVAVVLVLALGRALWADAALRVPWRVATLVLLGGAHAALHWRLLRAAPVTLSRLVLLLSAQAALAAALGALVQSPLVTLTLCLILLGESVGLLPRVGAAVAGAALLGVVATHALLIGRAAELTHLLWVIPPMAAFVVIWVELFQRQWRERNRAEAALRELDDAHRKLAEYADQVEELTLSAERQRIARELHDTLAQGLAGLILQLEAVDAHLRRGDTARVDAILRQARERARGALAEARRAIDDLRATAGPEPSLVAAIREEAERFSSSTGIQCELELDESVQLAPELSAHARRCVSECLANAARHARATHARVSLSRRDGAVELEVEDDGAGFEPATVEAQGHYGLVGMRERARLAGGSFEVRSAAGKGTRIKLSLPLTEVRAP